MRTLSAPISICLGITNKCNLRCKHCLASNSRYSEDLTTNEVLNIISQIRELKVLNIAIFGGEPLMRKDFFAILEALSRLKINLSLNTNAILITKKMASRLSRYPIKVYTVSLDGSCAKVQDPFRGKGSFEKNIEGIRNLVQEKCNVVISTTVSRFNYKDLENIVLLGRTLGANKVRFNNVVYLGNAICYQDSLIIKAEEKFRLLEEINILKDRFGDFLTGSLFEICNIMDEIRNNPKEVFPLKIHSCGAATIKCAILPDGWVTPCEIIWDAKAGNLKNQSLYDIWHNSSVMKVFREPLEIRGDDVPECNGCRYLRLCYKGHRCQPYYYPGARFEHKELYCWRKDVIDAN